MDLKDWIQVISTVVLSSTAFLAPYLVEKWKFTYRLPKLRIKFKLAPPDCHLTHMGPKESGFPVYYFRFLVENIGNSQADDCEVFIEKVYKENSAGEMIELINFTPVNLKWSGIRDPYKRTIQPGKEMYCDIGRVQHPLHNYKSIYWGISDNEQAQNKFIFELPELYYSQWDCLLPGKYRVKVSVYSNNTEKTSRQFKISWTGKWQSDEQNMFNELVIS